MYNAGTYQGLRSGFALYGTEGTLHLDLDSKKLTLAIKEEGLHTLEPSYTFISKGLFFMYSGQSMLQAFLQVGSAMKVLTLGIIVSKVQSKILDVTPR